MQERGIKPELEVFNGRHLNESLAILDSEGSRSLGQPARSAGDEFDDPPHLNLVFGGGTTTIPHPRNLLNMVANLPESVEFNVLAFGPHQLPPTTMGILLGGHARVGLEDNLYYRSGELAESNAQLVERTARIAAELGRPVATPTTARELLGL